MPLICSRIVYTLAMVMREKIEVRIATPAKTAIRTHAQEVAGRLGLDPDKVTDAEWTRNLIGVALGRPDVVEAANKRTAASRSV
jgi:hypothetical protein